MPGRRRRPQHEWEVLIVDHHAGHHLDAVFGEPATYGKEPFQPRRAILRSDQEGTALLSGLLRCGRCGRSMQVGYSGSTGKVGRYLCGGRREQRGSGPCLQIGSLKLDRAVSEQALEAYLLQSNLATGSARWLFRPARLPRLPRRCRCCEAEILHRCKIFPSAVSAACGDVSRILWAIYLTQPIQHLVAAPAFRRSSGRSGRTAVPTGRRACLARLTFVG